MRIVIDIDDNLYTRLFDNGNEYVADMRRACVAIRKGTPLPKGHGRLIDADALKMNERVCGDRYLSKTSLFVANKVIEQADTIIKADKEV